ncbi:conserved protein of unknown function [Rhodovastum atsumiense]|uniref:FeoB-associated Cys-rich membrane protein n=1 Tax=Rhodovastum atsumiense TaxID=504468 RepID=A0A5M6IKD4_9PROT|nr:hypothetical protein [Rhodovastum atsumiense]KAA5608018.1 hypothetical protein F1189_31060 [Rhodovastum atsumiense]CAH2598661.1 conserved protein of unknown function [Rhodovastum atsumiense]
MMSQSWWDVAGLTVIGLGCLGLILRRLRLIFLTSRANGCARGCGCAKACGTARTMPGRPDQA